MAWSRKDWLLLLLLTLFAAGLRFYQLGQLPPGFQFDEAFNAIDAQLVLEGNRPLFLPANAGREVLYTYFQAALAALFGLSVTTLRLASAILGTLAVPVTFLLYRRILQAQSRTIAASTALVLAVSLWHVHFSHYGIRVISMPVLFSVLFGLVWLGAHAATPRRRLIAYGMAGTLTGLSVWTHPTGRLAPFVLIGFALWQWWRHPARRRWSWDSPLGGLLIMGTAALAVFLPLGIEFYRHPEFFFGHASEVSVFAERVSGNSPGQVLLDNFIHILGMFTFAGDREWTHNLAGRPVFDWALGALFYAGLLIWWRRTLRRPTGPDQDAFALLAIWAVGMLFPSILSEAAPNYSRMMPALPALFTAAGLGLTWLLHLRRPLRWVGPLLAGLVVVYSTGQMVYDYFVRFAAQPEVYYMYDADKLDALEYLQPFTTGNQVYLSQLWGDRHATVHFLRGEMGIKSVDTGDTIVLPPPGQGAVYAFPAEQQTRAEQLAALWAVAVEPVPDIHGRPLLYVVRLAAELAESWPPGYPPTLARTAHFVDAPTLLGMQAAEPDKQVSLFWQADASMARSLTTFIHLIDRDGRRVGQIDKLPGNGSYPTTVWTPGERVIDRSYPTLLDVCAGGETVRVQVGWYDLDTPETPHPRADAAGHTALAGELTLQRFAYPLGYYGPQVGTDTPISPTLTLLGYTLHGSDLQPGSPLTLDLMWHGRHAAEKDAPTDMEIGIWLGDERADPIWRGALAPGTDWEPDFGYCSRLRATLPLDIAPGDYPLRLHWDGPAGAQQANLGSLTLGPSSRRFDLPELTTPVHALLSDELGGEVRLAGTTAVQQQATDEGRTLAVTLVWQEVARVEDNYRVFVHLLDQSGAIVAQSDGAPAGGYNTNRWVPDEVVLDEHRLALPPDLPPGQYQLVAGMYEPIGGVRLRATSAAGQALAGDLVPLGEVRLSP